MRSQHPGPELWYEIIRRIEVGESQTAIAKRHGMSIGQFRYRLRKHVQTAESETAAALEPDCEPAVSLDAAMLDETWTPSSGRNRLVLMVKEPTTLFAYWEVNELRKRLISEHFQSEWGNLPFFLHLYDVTDIHFDGYNAHSTKRIAVHALSDNYYVHGIQPRRRYLADFGTVTWEGRFFTILRSNLSEMPPTSNGQAVPVVQFATPAKSAVHEVAVLEPWQEQFDGYSLTESKGGCD